MPVKGERRRGVAIEGRLSVRGLEIVAVARGARDAKQIQGAPRWMPSARQRTELHGCNSGSFEPYDGAGTEPLRSFTVVRPATFLPSM